MLRLVHVHLQLGIRVQNAAAQLHGHVHGIDGEALVRTPGQHLEGAAEVLAYLQTGLGNFLEILVYFIGGADGIQAEDLFDPVYNVVHILEFRHIDAGIRQPHGSAGAFYGLFHIVGQDFQEAGAIEPLEIHLAEANQQYFTH